MIMVMNRLSIVLLILIFLPVTSMAAAKKHQPVPADQACGECHETEAGVWQDHKHGLMGVGCVVCHGDLDQNFLKRPSPERCNGCHAEQVAGKAKEHKVKPKSCWSCHNGHTLLTSKGR